MIVEILGSHHRTPDYAVLKVREAWLPIRISLILRHHSSERDLESMVGLYGAGHHQRPFFTNQISQNQGIRRIGGPQKDWKRQNGESFRESDL